MGTVCIVETILWTDLITSVQFIFIVCTRRRMNPLTATARAHACL